jgi:pimeloyl-ACP methyl ester carboxylesterase
MATETPETRYTRTPEGTYLAYQVTGSGSLDLVIPITGSAAVELLWDEPHFKRFIGRLSSIARVVTFDPRGFGSSGRLAAESVPALQLWKDDIVSVMDSAGCEQAALLAWGEAAGATMFFAATYPERASSLVLINSYARYWRSNATPWGLPFELIPSYVGAIRDAWGSGTCLESLAPSIVPTDEARRHWARIERLTATPDVLGAATQAVFESDVSEVTFDMSTVATWPVALATPNSLSFLVKTTYPFPETLISCSMKWRSSSRGCAPLLSTSEFFLPSCSPTSSAQRSDYQNWGITAGSRSSRITMGLFARTLSNSVARRSTQPATDFWQPSTVRPEPSNARVQSGTK